MTRLEHATIEVRPMTATDVRQAHALSHALQWPHRLEDWALMQQVAQGWVAEIQAQTVGSAFACHQGDYSSIGLVIVSADWQGRGIGRRLMAAALASAGPRTAILNATAEGAPLYASMGFETFAQVQQFQGLVQPPALAALPAREHYRDLQPGDGPRQVELAHAGSGLERRAILKALEPVTEHAVGIESAGQLQAWALLRRFGRGLCIGPVIAQNIDQARHLIGQLLAKVPGAFVRIDIVADAGLSAWLHSAGLAQVDSTVSMSNGSAPRPTQGVRQFAVVTQALG